MTVLAIAVIAFFVVAVSGMDVKVFCGKKMYRWTAPPIVGRGSCWVVRYRVYEYHGFSKKQIIQMAEKGEI